MTLIAYRDSILAADGRQTRSGGHEVIRDTFVKITHTRTDSFDAVWAFSGTSDTRLLVEDFMRAGDLTARPPKADDGDSYHVIGAVVFPSGIKGVMRFSDRYVRVDTNYPLGNLPGIACGPLGDICEGTMLAGKSASDAVGLVSTIAATSGPIVYSADVNEVFRTGKMTLRVARYYRTDAGVLNSVPCDTDGIDLYGPRSAARLKQRDLFEVPPPLMSLDVSYDPDNYREFPSDEVRALRAAARAMGGV